MTAVSAVADVPRVRLDVGIEQRLPDDAEGEPHHFLGDVERGAVGPAALDAIGILGHRRGIGRDAILVERRLHQPPLAQVDRRLRW